MKKNTLISLLSLLLAIVMLASCGGGGGASDAEHDSESLSASETAGKSETDGETQNEAESGSQEIGSKDEPVSEIETDGENDGEETEGEELYVMPEGDYASLIYASNSSVNKVNAYFTDYTHNGFTVENEEMSFTYNTAQTGSMMVSALTDKSGNAYLENSMDVFVRMKDGSTFYTSNSATPAVTNLLRMGYYYYEARFEEQLFAGEGEVTGEKVIKLKVGGYKDVTEPKMNADKALECAITDPADPYIVLSGVSYETFDFAYLRLTARVDNPRLKIYLMAGGSKGFGDDCSKIVNLIADGEYHTYLIPLSTVSGYEGKLTGMRLDFTGEIGDSFAIKELSAIALDGNKAPESLSVARSFIVYTDKMHHYFQVAATAKTENVDVFGMLTRLDADTVAKLVIKDGKGTHNTLDGVDFSSVEYVGFDVKNAGIFGYILPYDGQGGQLKVWLEDGCYVIEQTMSPENGTLNPSVDGTKNANDFYMGQRIYTDDSHSFDTFLYEAECERNPLTEKNFAVDKENSTQGSFDGYDALKGFYRLHVEGLTGFSIPYYNFPQKHFNVKFTLTGVEEERKLYVATYNGGSCLECSVILDKNGMSLPVPVEVGKNFSEPYGSGDRNLYNLDDATYSEALFPMIAEVGKDVELNVLHLYQMWGQFPLKQLSWIQFGAPYYHLSTGVTETNCIIPYGYTKQYRSITYLPDFRAMSAPLWSTQPQHNRGGDHTFMVYTDAEGNYSAIECVQNVINSYGPTYADVDMVFISDDGKIKLTVNHAEMPQTDENRTYYQMKYEILGDISFKDFAHDFSFYSVDSADPTGLYRKVGYLNENNQSVVVDAVKDKSVKEYVLGDTFPYFDFFLMENYTSTAMEGYTNLAMLIKDADFIIGGQEKDPSFLLINTDNTLRLSLDLERVDLKAGDSFVINAILLPWGSQASDYSGSAPDKNVRDVRENSLIDPFKLTAGENAQVLDSEFIPKLKTTNGTSAEFTVSGGTNNVTVQIFGFNKLTAPVIEEKTDAGWVTYEVNSVNAPDKLGNRHPYDGYGVTYERDGSYSYSFVIDMTDCEQRAFRIKASEDFGGWGEMPEIPGAEIVGPYKDYAGSTKLAGLETSQRIKADVSLMDNGDYVRYQTAGPDFWVMMPFVCDGATGQYAVMKYRILQPEGDMPLSSVEIFASTQNSAPTAGDNAELIGALRSDGEWHLLIIDLSALGIPSFTAQDGEYFAKYLRVDLVNYAVSAETKFDVGFLAVCDDLSAILDSVKEDFATADLCLGKQSVKEIDCASGEEIVPPETEIPACYTNYATPEKLSAGGYVRFDSVKVSADGSYISYKTTKLDASVTTYFTEPSGRYVVIKYRVVKDTAEAFDFGYVELFTSTKNEMPTAGDNYTLKNAIIADGEWHLLIVDASQLGLATVTESNGDYALKYFRFDPVNQDPIHQNTSIDIAFIATASGLDDIPTEEAE